MKKGSRVQTRLRDAHYGSTMSRVAAGEALGYDRMLKTNTTKRRVHSLFRQGCMLYELMPTMREQWLGPLMQRFSLMLHDQPLFTEVFGPV